MRTGLNARKSLRRAAATAVAVLLFGASVWYIAATFQLQAVGAVLGTARVGWLLVAASVIPLYWATRTIRWRVLLCPTDEVPPFWDMYIAVAVALGIANFTPFQSGELVKVELLRKHSGMLRLPGYSSFAVERVADLVAVLMLAVVGLLMGVQFGANRSVLLIVAVGLIAFLALVAYVVLQIPLRGIVGRFQAQIGPAARDRRVVTAVAALTFAGWGLVAAGWYAMLLAVGIDVGYPATVLMMSLLTLVGIASLVPGAIGVGEVGATLFLLQYGQTAAQAQAGALILRCYGLIILALSVLHFGIWRWIRRRKAA